MSSAKLKALLSFSDRATLKEYEGLDLDADEDLAELSVRPSANVGHED